MWHVALGWHGTEFAQTSAILKFYIWFRFRPHHRSRHVILHQSPKFYPNRTTLGRKKITSYRFSRWRISAILDFRGPIIGSLKSPCTISYRSSIDNIALNVLVFEKMAFFWHFGIVLHIKLGKYFLFVFVFDNTQFSTVVRVAGLCAVGYVLSDVVGRRIRQTWTSRKARNSRNAWTTWRLWTIRTTWYTRSSR